MCDTAAADRRRKIRLIFTKLCSGMRRAWSSAATRPPVCKRRKHEDDYHDGGSRSHRIFCGFFRRAPCNDKEGTDISGTLLPVLRSRNGLQLYKPRAMPCNGFRHRWQLRTARWGRSIRRSSSAQVTYLAHRRSGRNARPSATDRCQSCHNSVERRRITLSLIRPARLQRP